MNMEEDKKSRAVARGKRAQAFVADPVVGEMFDDLEAKYLADWRATKPEDAAKRERIYTAINMIEDLKSVINTAIANGRMAERN